jgi:anti-anti-sigma factor
MPEQAALLKDDSGHYQLSGDITFQTSPGLLRQLDNFRSADSRVEISFSQVGRIDSSCVALMLECLRNARKNQVELVFSGVPATLSDLIALFQLSKRLPVRQN